MLQILSIKLATVTLQSLQPGPDSIMDPLTCDNAIYEDIQAVSCHEGFDIHDNKCYGKVSSSGNVTKQDSTHVEKNHSCSKVIIVLFVTMFALLLGTAGTCVAFALQITTLKSEIASLQMASSSFTCTLEEVVHQLNTSIDMLYQQLSQQNASNEQLNEQLNQQLSQQNASLDSSNQQLRQEYTALDNRTQQLSTSTQLLFNGLKGPAGQNPFYPADSCATLPPSSPSGYYWVRASDGSAVSVYCDITRSCGGVTGGWMRVAGLDMTNGSHQCPSGLMERTDSGKRTCVRIETTRDCSSINNFITPGVDYSSVCGRVIGYQYGETDAFFGDNINSVYVDGVSLTHGNPRQHIWSFAAARDEVGSVPSADCPCTNTNQLVPSTYLPPAFVGNDYFCDTGSEDRSQLIFYGDDPLWDGAGCGPLNTCCSFNTPPWFYKQLPQPTTDDIEMRVCTVGNPIDNEEVAIEIVEMYVR